MPLEQYMNDDPFENHPLFKTEEQARIEETMDGVQVDRGRGDALDWPVAEDTFIDRRRSPTPPSSAAAEPVDDRPALRREPLVALPRLRLGRLNSP